MSAACWHGQQPQRCMPAAPAYSHELHRLPRAQGPQALPHPAPPAWGGGDGAVLQAVLRAWERVSDPLECECCPVLSPGPARFQAQAGGSRGAGTLLLGQHTQAWLVVHASRANSAAPPLSKAGVGCSQASPHIGAGAAQHCDGERLPSQQLSQRSPRPPLRAMRHNAAAQLPAIQRRLVPSRICYRRAVPPAGQPALCRRSGASLCTAALAAAATQRAADRSVALGTDVCLRDNATASWSSEGADKLNIWTRPARGAAPEWRTWLCGCS